MRRHLILMGLLLAASALSGQKTQQPLPFAREQIVKEKSVLVRTDEAEAMRERHYSLVFPNVNKTDSYVDAKTLARIAELERSMAGADEPEAYLHQMDTLLMGYIRNFGIRNFSENNGLLWKAGRVKQLLGDTVRAVYLYEMAHNHDFDENQYWLSYDTLTASTRSDWVPIEKYYEMLEVRQKIDPLIPPRKVLQPMGQRINSDDADYAPFTHPSDSILIFTSRRDTSGIKMSEFIDPFSTQNEDIYYSEIDFITGEWTYARRLSDTINSSSNEGSACLAPDGKTLFFTRCNNKGYGDCDIYQATYDPATGRWGEVQNLGKGVNSYAWDSQPNIAADGKTLFFISNRRGGFGGTDIYVTTLSESGAWTPAQNLGPIVNTWREEVTPFYHSINKTLYFSSTGHPTQFGGFDIFKSRWISDRWSSPANVGPLVNTEGNQYYFSISGKATKIFYANSLNPEEDHERQNFDLYSFDMPMEARPDAIARFRGMLVDSVSGYPLYGTAMIVDLEEGTEVAPKRVNEEGFFEFSLVNDRRYRLYVLGDNFLTVKNEFVMHGDTTFEIFTQSFEENKPLVFETLEFKSNSSKLSPTLKPKLEYLARFLQTYPMFKLEIEGHTDADGSSDANRALSLSRSQAIAKYLIAVGSIPATRLTAKGYGEERPIVPNDTEENKRKNRRVEFRLVLDENYKGDMFLPTAEELNFDDDLESEYVPDPEFAKPFDWDPAERDEWENELLLDEEMDLGKELENDQILKLGTEDDEEEAEEKKDDDDED